MDVIIIQAIGFWQGEIFYFDLHETLAGFYAIAQRANALNVYFNSISRDQRAHPCRRSSQQHISRHEGHC